MKVKIFEDKFSRNKTDGLIFEPHSHFQVSRKRLEFGDTNRHRNDAIAKIDIKNVKNFEISIDFKMINDYGNDTWWFGLKCRSTNSGLTDGYLVYVRSNGNMAIYTAGADLQNAQFKSTSSILNRKINLKISLVDAKFTISIDGNETTYSDRDNKLPRDGYLYLYSNHTKNLIYGIKIWKIMRLSSPIVKKIFPLLGLLLLAVIVFVLYHFSPQTVDNLLNDPRFRLWSNMSF